MEYTKPQRCFGSSFPVTSGSWFSWTRTRPPCAFCVCCCSPRRHPTSASTSRAFWGFPTAFRACSAMCRASPVDLVDYAVHIKGVLHADAAPLPVNVRELALPCGPKLALQKGIVDGVRCGCGKCGKVDQASKPPAKGKDCRLQCAHHKNQSASKRRRLQWLGVSLATVSSPVSGRCLWYFTSRSALEKTKYGRGQGRLGRRRVVIRDISRLGKPQFQRLSLADSMERTGRGKVAA